MSVPRKGKSQAKNGAGMCRITQRMGRTGSVVNSPTLGFQLLGEHVSTEGNAAFESYRRKIGTLPAFSFRPGAQCRNKSRYGGANKAQEAEVGSDSLNTIAVFRTVRAELQELNDARKIFAARGAFNPCDVLHLCRKRVLDRRCNQGTAIRHKELQQENH